MANLRSSLQNMEKALKAMGYKTQVQPLNHFHEAYGLEGDEEGEEEDDEDEDEDDDDDMSEEEDALMDGAEGGSEAGDEMER